MAKRKSKWQAVYDAIKDWETPQSLRAIINLAWKIVKKFPKITPIAMKAFEISKEWENEDIAGYLKKRKVVAGINRIAKEFEAEIPKKVAYFINEACSLAAELTKKKK